MEKEKPIRPGRPLKGDSKRERTSFTLMPEQIKWLEQQANSINISKSELLSKIIDSARYSGHEISSLLQTRFPISKKAVTLFCQKYHVKKMSLFGSILRDDFDDESDIDVLIEFDAGSEYGFFTIVQMEKELSKLLGGRKVDIRTKSELSKYFRSDVIRDEEILYAA